MLKESDILHENGNHWVIAVPYGFEVYRNELTHAVRCAQIGYKGQHGLDRAIAECERRETAVTFRALPETIQARATTARAPRPDHATQCVYCCRGGGVIRNASKLSGTTVVCCQTQENSNVSCTLLTR